MVKTVRMAAAVLLGLLALQVAPARAADDIDSRAVARARDFLDPAARGRDILSYVHFGSKYRDHSYKDTRFVTSGGQRVPGHFGLVYTFAWGDNDETDVAFLCDANGRVYEVKTLNTTAILNQPFLAANLTVKLLGNLLIEAFKNQMNEADRRQVQKLVDDADAKGMLEWSLKFQQSLGN
jgi:hypothetical protein